MNPLQRIRAIPDKVEAALVATFGRSGAARGALSLYAQGIVFRNE
ncbi:hypothetical protein ABEV00_06660 [Paenibacillus thiaminolyticus]